MADRAAQIRNARALIETGISGDGGVWADLGCGDGVFTSALYELVGDDAEIHAVDKNRRALEALKRHFAKDYPGARVHSQEVDFTGRLDLPALDGLLMANSLHFVRGKAPLLAQLAELLKPGGRLIVVEYNTSRGNTWVPYPFDEDGFLDLAAAAGLKDARILKKIPTSFLGEFYSGLALR